MRDNFLKVVSATYRVLDYLPDSDPLKARAKDKVIKILENLTIVSDRQGWINMKNLLSKENEEAKSQLLKDIEVLESYLKLGECQGWVDGVNFLILKKEYDEIRRQINIPRFSVKESIEKNARKEIAKDKPKAESNQSEEFSTRQEKIMKMLLSKEKIQVSDIIKEIPNVTKRTIRRDLDILLKTGKITRNGEFNQVFYQKSDRTQVGHRIS